MRGWLSAGAGPRGRPAVLAADDDAHRQIEESRRYLADFETALEHSSTPPDLIARMTATNPDLANPYTLWLAAYDLLGSKT